MSIKRQALQLIIAIVAIGVTGSCTSGSADAASERPNILIILADDQGYGDVSYHEHPPEVSTPGIDQLAGEGLVFTNAYASAYVCAPTRAGLLTGRYQQRFGFYRAADSRKGMPLDEITLADILKEKGYSCGIFGKWHLGLDPAFRPLERGFDRFYGFLGHGAHDYFELGCTSGNEHNCIYRDSIMIDDTGYLTDNLAREACEFIKTSAAGKQPFFLYLPFNAVHWPLQAPEEDVSKFNTGDRERDIYLGMLHRMDRAVDQVITTLKETGSYENSLIFYFSDNGGAAKVHADNRPLRDYKQSTYEGGIRVPFIVTWPGKINHGSIHEPVISLDLFPTILDILGVPLSEDRIIDGRSLYPLMSGDQNGILHEYLFWDGDEDRWAVRNGRWKLVKNRKGEIELYDLESDIGERNDLAVQHPDVLARLHQAYKQWRSEMGTPMER